MDTPAIILASDSHHCLATWDRTMIQVWRGATTEPATVNMCAVASAFAAKHSGSASIVIIIEPTAEIPSSAVRTEYARFTRETASQVACCILVPEGGGFRSSLVRSVVVSVAALLRQSFPYSFANDVDAAINLLGPHLSPASGGREALRRAVTDLRARIRP